MPTVLARTRVCLYAGLLFSFLLLSNQAIAQGTGAVPSPWVSRDIGSPSPAGGSTFTQGIFRVAGGGADIGGASDQFRFVYQTVNGDVDITARVDAITANTLAAKTGVMIRGALTANAVHAFATVPADKGVAFQRRTQAGGATTTTPGPGLRAPVWLRLVRMGTAVTAMSSEDGSNWTTIGTDSVAFGATVYVGLAVTSRNPGATAVADLSNVSITPISLPLGQRSADIGSPIVRGSTTYMQGVYAVTGAGTDIWDNADQFQFAYQQVAGDV